MALKDILRHIEANAQAQVHEIEVQNQRDIDLVMHDAAAEVDSYASERLSSAKKKARQKTRALLINARLQVRDEELRVRRQMVDAVFEQATQDLAGLDTEEWLSVYVPRIASSARAGEQLLIGSKESVDRESLRKALSAAGVKVTVLDAGSSQAQAELHVFPPDFEYGARVVGERTSVDISKEQVIAQMRSQLELKVQHLLFAAVESGN